VDPPIIVNPPDGTTQSMTIQCTTTAPSCDFGTPFDSIVITEVLRGLVGGLVTETFKWPAFFPPVPPDLLQTITVLPATVGVGVTCTPNTIVNNSGATGATNCTATFSDNDIFPSTVASGNVTLTLVSATGAVFTSTGAPTASFRCGATNNAPQGCSTVNFSIQSNPPAPATAVAPGTATTRPATTSAPAVGAIGVQVAFTPDLPGVNNQLVTTVNNVLNVTPAPAGPVPNTPASLTVTGPATIACGASGNITATLRDAGGTVVAAPTQVSFNSSLGTIASPVMTAAGVATTTLAAPGTGAGGSAQVTATAAGLTAQTLVTLTACTAAPGPVSPASLVVTGPATATIACGAVGNITATLRDAGGALIATPTLVSFSTSSGVIASPTSTVNGVATTTLAAPSTGGATTAVITATAAGLTTQTVVSLAACASPITTTTTSPTVPYVPYFQPIMPYYPPVQQPYVQQPVQPQQPIVNVTGYLPPSAFPRQPAAAPATASKPPQAAPTVAPAIFRPPNTGDGGLKTLAE
jgi:hypothetical protein